MVAVLALLGANSARAFLGMNNGPAIGEFPAGYSGNVGCTNTDPGITGDFDIAVGWLAQRDGSIWSLERQNSTGTATWPLKGLWVQSARELMFDRRYGLFVSTGFLIPQHMSGTWITRPSGVTFDFDIPSHDWWYVDGIVKARISDGFDILTGVRWDRTSTRVDYSDNTSDDYVLNSYLPLIGAQMNKRSSESSLLVRFIGSPVVYGNMKYHYWDRRGYAEFGDFRVNSRSSFLEILAD